MKCSQCLNSGIVCNVVELLHTLQHFETGKWL